MKEVHSRSVTGSSPGDDEYNINKVPINDKF